MGRIFGRGEKNFKFPLKVAVKSVCEYLLRV